jgi:ferrous iron transport protein A
MRRTALSSIRTASPVTVVALNVEFAVRERLTALGLKPGRRIEVVRRMGSAGPVQVRVDHTDLVLRASEAAGIEVEGAP